MQFFYIFYEQLLNNNHTMDTNSFIITIKLLTALFVFDLRSWMRLWCRLSNCQLSNRLQKQKLVSVNKSNDFWIILSEKDTCYNKSLKINCDLHLIIDDSWTKISELFRVNDFIILSWNQLFNHAWTRDRVLINGGLIFRYL